MPLLTGFLLLVAELGGAGLVYKLIVESHCHASYPLVLCQASSGLIISTYCLVAAFALFAMFNRDALRQLFRTAGQNLWPLAVNGLGAVLMLSPLVLLRGTPGTVAPTPGFALWAGGTAVMLLSLCLWLAPPRAWWQLARDNRWTLLPVLVGGFLTPLLAIQVRSVWRLETLATATFDIVTWIVRTLGYDVISNPANKEIGTEAFSISIAPACSGIEGIALVVLFVTLYLFLFRHDLRFPRVLLLYPLGIAASMTFNVVRIALLLIIGLEGNSALAVGGFHSHAGWLLFTLIALGIIALAQTVPALKRNGPAAAAPARPPAPALPFWRDPAVARILPFAVFMLSALIVSTISQAPGMLYPGRVLLVAAVVAGFLPVYRRLAWRADPVALAAGAVIGLYWVLIPVAPTDTPPYGALSGGLLIGWFIFRGLGTVVLVPLVEELFFRDYLEERLRLGSGRLWTVLAAVVSAGLFAALHDRWAEAFVAGLIFSAVMRRRGNVTDPILAHATANAIVYGTAVATGNLAII
ncbi:CAAX amino terminal protease family protein (plasmid) [Rhodovulum sp. P5]|uniref:exosortase E/protease, VPEID-CTERM system n=1 Tax=Rhodovulum sp. P5 TaxID=1564506 RepID=UPI0009C1C0FB|nr:exosortase E/protease, VPEID-CTERM system [Rhodovulum sp. P5]ARE42503.1 hypothetical protein RGUI_4186 [Rhodovulum sp. P5]ARE42556.1 CAAX amino terminal protease family protein [Rhodovulum sp. P5]